MKIISVFLSMRGNKGEAFFDNAFDLGCKIASLYRDELQIVFGGNNCGSMRALVEGARKGDSNCKVSTVSFRDLVVPNPKDEVIWRGSDECIMCNTIETRKDVMTKKAHCFVILPGGVGTVEELYYVFSLKSRGLEPYKKKGIFLLNQQGWFDGLLKQSEKSKDLNLGKFDKGIRDFCRIADNLDELINLLKDFFNKDKLDYCDPVSEVFLTSPICKVEKLFPSTKISDDPIDFHNLDKILVGNLCKANISMIQDAGRNSRLYGIKFNGDKISENKLCKHRIDYHASDGSRLKLDTCPMDEFMRESDAFLMLPSDDITLFHFFNVCSIKGDPKCEMQFKTIFIWNFRDFFRDLLKWSENANKHGLSGTMISNACCIVNGEDCTKLVEVISEEFRKHISPEALSCFDCGRV